MPLLPVELLNKRYRIVSLLGDGPYGAVYRAYDVVDEREVAVKEYLDPSPETARLFRAEANRLSALNHPQIPAVWDHFYLVEAVCNPKMDLLVVRFSTLELEGAFQTVWIFVLNSP